MISEMQRWPREWLGREESRGSRTFLMTEATAGKKGTIQSFFEPHQMRDILAQFYLEPKDRQVLNFIFANPLNGWVIRNCDAVIWGYLRRRRANNTRMPLPSLNHPTQML